MIAPEPLTRDELITLKYRWHFWARPEQAMPKMPYAVWLILSGRAWGKTRTGAEWVRAKAIANPGCHIALVGATSADVRDTMIGAGKEHVPGASGLLAICPPWERPLYEPSKRLLTWVNGSVATCYSAEEPDRLRGPSHHYAWVDEVAAWAKNQEAWDQLLFGLRVGAQPQAVVTTTPRPIKVLKQLLARSDALVTRGTTADNAANMPQAWLAQMEALYAGTRLGRQELEGELLETIDGALWTCDIVDPYRVPVAPTCERIVVAIDPAVSNTATSDETGIIAAGLKDGHYYVLADASGKYSPIQWARKAVELYHSLKADLIVGEANNGGDMVKDIIRQVDPNAPIKLVHASKGKIARAEPVVALYEQGKVHHALIAPLLEDQMLSYVAGAPSPDRIDALVWALWELRGSGASESWLDYAEQIVTQSK